MNSMGQPTGNWLCGVSVTGVRSARDSLGLHFIDNSSISRNHLAGDGIHLVYAGTEILLEYIAFCLNNFL